jgi:hypothetical protein
MSKCVQAAVVLFLVLSATGVRSEEGSGDVRPDYQRAVVFFRHFQDALKRNDRDEVSRLIQYPLLASLHNKSVKIRARRELLANFDAIFDKGVRCEVMQATDKDVWGNWRGFMVGGGAIWFDDFSPPGTNDNVNAPDYWIKGTFLVMTVNNEAFYDCKAGSL